MDSTRKSFVVEYGPIRIRHRRKSPQTLATGRRPKHESTSDEDPLTCEIRRSKNRLAARELKKKRENIEVGLLKTISQLEEERSHLEKQHKDLEEYRAQLNRAVYNAKQAPWIPLILDMDMASLEALDYRSRDFAMDQS